jgi:Na+-driven multidrug efflux pump
MVLLNFVLIPIYGILGSAIATLISQICSTLLFDLLNKKTRKIFILKLSSFLFFKINLKSILMNNEIKNNNLF